MNRREALCGAAATLVAASLPAIATAEGQWLGAWSYGPGGNGKLKWWRGGWRGQFNIENMHHIARLERDPDCLMVLVELGDGTYLWGCKGEPNHWRRVPEQEIAWYVDKYGFKFPAGIIHAFPRESHHASTH